MSLGAIWAAAGAGLGVTVRTRAGMPKHLSLRDDLPQLPAIGLVLYRAKAEPAQAVQAPVMASQMPLPVKKAHGGAIGYAEGGSDTRSFAVNGPGTGRSDSIPAKLSDGEYVMDAETVALLGDGSSKAGADKLDQMRVNLRKAKGRNLAEGKFSVKAKQPLAYLSGGSV